MRSDICSLLVTAGASLLVKDNEARTARMLAVAAGADTCLLSYLESQGLTIIIMCECVCDQQSKNQKNYLIIA